jgi:hypothetical protein
MARPPNAELGLAPRRNSGEFPHRWDELLMPDQPSLLAELGKLLGLDGLAWDAQGCCLLTMGDDLVVGLSPTSEDIWRIEGFVEACPTSEAGPFFRHALRINGELGQVDPLARLGLQEATDFLVLSRPIVVKDLNAPALLDLIESFVGLIESARRQLALAMAETPGPTALPEGAEIA